MGFNNYKLTSLTDRNGNEKNEGKYEKLKEGIHFNFALSSQDTCTIAKWSFEVGNYMEGYEYVWKTSLVEEFHFSETEVRIITRNSIYVFENIDY